MTEQQIMEEAKLREYVSKNEGIIAQAYRLGMKDATVKLQPEINKAIKRATSNYEPLKRDDHQVIIQHFQSEHNYQHDSPCIGHFQD